MAVDTETTGLRPYHGDRLFSIIVCAVEGGSEPSFSPLYFNFQPYPGLDAGYVLLPSHLEALKKLFARDDVEWFGANIKYDMHILEQEGIQLGGALHCTQTIGRVEFNDHMSYGLDACAQRIGLRKDDAVEKYIAQNKLVEKRQGANQAYTHKFFDRVPYPIIVPYGLQDAEVTARVSWNQKKTCRELSDETPVGLPNVLNIVENEKRLTRTIFRMERVGLRIDRDYCVRAARYEADRSEKAALEFKALTGRSFLASGKLFGEVFKSDREDWGVTENGGPSFNSEALALFKNPAALEVLKYRDAKSKSDFYRGFLFHADSNGDVHPHFNSAGTATGRFSSADPNFQNLTNADEAAPQEFEVRRAIVPRPGFLLYSLDWSSAEYILFFEYICRYVGRLVEVARQIRDEGKDPHQATADITHITRKRAKAVNFCKLFGGGDKMLAETIGGTIQEARNLSSAIYSATPEMEPFMRSVQRTAELRGFIRNWAGRRLYCANPRFSYKMVNWLIQSSAADVNKFALNRIDEILLGRRTRMICNIHDEIILEAPENEVDAIAAVKEIMETVFPSQYLPMKASVEWSEKSLADLHA